MNKLILVLSLLLALSFQAAVADTHILSGSTSSAIVIDQYNASSDYDTTLGLGVGYDYAMANGFQLGGTLSASLFDGGSIVGISAGPGYNFSSDIANSFFLAFNIGHRRLHIDSSITTDETFLSLRGAKRFKLTENVSFVPGVRAEKIIDDNAPDPSFIVDLFNFSILF